MFQEVFVPISSTTTQRRYRSSKCRCASQISVPNLRIRRLAAENSNDLSKGEVQRGRICFKRFRDQKTKWYPGRDSNPHEEKSSEDFKSSASAIPPPGHRWHIYLTMFSRNGRCCALENSRDFLHRLHFVI